MRFLTGGESDYHTWSMLFTPSLATIRKKDNATLVTPDIYHVQIGNKPPPYLTHNSIRMNRPMYLVGLFFIIRGGFPTLIR